MSILLRNSFFLVTDELCRNQTELTKLKQEIRDDLAEFRILSKDLDEGNRKAEEKALELIERVAKIDSISSQNRDNLQLHLVEYNSMMDQCKHIPHCKLSCTSESVN